LLLAVAAWLLWPGIHGPFLFDDEPNLRNLRELDSHFTRASIGTYLSLFSGMSGRPLAALSFLLNDDAWPSAPLGFKLTNLWIHLLNGVLVFGLARSIGRARGMARSDLAALVAAAIWLLNPIQMSAIFLTVQRMTELAGTFVFAGMWAYVALAQRTITAWRAVAAICVLGLGTVLAFLCKENGALVPLLALVLNTTLLRDAIARLPLHPGRLLRLGVWLPSLLLGAGFVWLGARMTSFAGRDFDLWERLMSQGRALVDYAGLIVVPRLSSSGLYNDDFPVSHGVLDPVTTLPAMLLVGAALMAGLALRRRMPLLSFAVLWFLAGHLIESSIIPLELYFEHRNYVPLFGPAFALAAAAMQLRGKLQRPVMAGLGIWLLLAASITHLQAKVWGDAKALATVWHAEHPTSLRAQQQYASWLFENGRTDEARAAFAQATRAGVSPTNTQLQMLLMNCSSGRAITVHQLDAVHALLADPAAPLTPGTAAILARLRLSVQAGQCPRDLPPEEWLRLTELVIDNPNGSGLVRMLLMERAELWFAADRLDDAIHDMDRAWAGSYEPRIAFYAAARLATAGRYDEARAWARRPLGQPWSWKRWLAQTDKQAMALIHAIDQSQAEQRNARQAADDATQPVP
jgi:tetratricopeptide (TPR) repeat protein